MRQLRTVCALAVVLLACPGVLRAQQQPETKLEIVPRNPEQGGGLVTDLSTGFTIATNGVLVKYGQAVLAADNAPIDPSTAPLTAHAHLRIPQREHHCATAHHHSIS